VTDDVDAKLPSVARELAIDESWLRSLLSAPRDAAYYADRAIRVREFSSATDIVRVLHGVRVALMKIADAPWIHEQIDSELDILMELYDRESRRWQIDQRAAMQTLSTGFAHELRNPLNSARLQLDVLERRLRRHLDDDEIGAPAGRARHEIERLRELVEDFLACTMPPPLTPVQCDVVMLIEHAVEVEQTFAQERGVELTFARPGVRLQARVDADKIRQLVKNLVRNALEAAPRGGHVTVRLDSEAGNVHIRVVDDGPGISDAVRARMFEPFYSTKDTGTGLGMSIVQSIVAMHGGTIAIKAASPGTDVDVALPRAIA
jgi:signal transduction histidine kinase